MGDFMIISDEPRIKSYQLYGFPECILEANFSNYEEWFVMNYNQLNAGISPSGNLFIKYLVGSAFGKHGVLDIKDYTNIVDLKNEEKVFQFIRESLKANKACYLHIDHYYIENYREYKREHLVHDIVIYDYDSADDSYLYMEFVVDAYKKFKINWLQLFEAISHHDNKCVFSFYLSEEATYDFNLEKFIRMQEDYLYSKAPENEGLYFDTNTFYSRDYYSFDSSIRCYGIDTYNLIDTYVNHAAKNREYVDYHLIYLMLEHDLTMNYKLDYLLKKNYINHTQSVFLKEKLHEIIKLLQIDLRRIMKYTFINFLKDDQLLLENVNQVYNLEKDFYGTLINLLKGNSK